MTRPTTDEAAQRDEVILTTMRLALRASAFALLTVGAAGCASSKGSASGAYAGGQSVQVKVRNDYWLDVVIYMVNGGARVRLGSVGGVSGQTLRVPPGALSASSIRLLIDPIGSSRGYTTEAITLAPGQQIELKVGSPLSLSTIAVYNR